MAILLPKQALPNGYTMTTIQSDLPKQSAMALSDLRVSDYDIIGSWSSQSPILAVAANSPWQTLDDFIEDARKTPANTALAFQTSVESTISLLSC